VVNSNFVKAVQEVHAEPILEPTAVLEVPSSSTAEAVHYSIETSDSEAEKAYMPTVKFEVSIEINGAVEYLSNRCIKNYMFK
jgi:hypothetical protein